MIAASLKVVLLGLVALLGWVSFVAVVAFTSPEAELALAGFFSLLFIALAASVSLVAYWLSFRLYAMRRHQGELWRAILQGGVPALFLTILAVFQSLRVLSWWAALPLGGMLVLVELLLWPRRAD